MTPPPSSVSAANLGLPGPGGAGLVWVDHAALLWASALLSLVVAARIWGRRSAPGGREMAAFMMAVAVWAGAAAVEAMVVAPRAKVFWSQVEYLGYAPAASLFLAFLGSFLRPEAGRRWRWLLVPVPVLTLAAAWTNPWHGWLWPAFTPLAGDRNVLLYHHGPWWWSFVTYSYALVAVGWALLLRAWRHAAGIHRRQLGALMVSAVFPVITGGLYVAGWEPVRGLDVSPIGFFATGGVVLLSMGRFGFFDLVPIARAALVEGLPDALVVADPQGRVVDLNPAARRWLGAEPAAHPLVKGALANGAAGSGEIEHPPGCWTDVRVVPLADGRGRPQGRLILLRDITGARRSAAERERLVAELREALANVRTLSGLLPICASCKKIRDDQGYWSSVETYVSRHADVQFTHGVCPECAARILAKE